MATENRYFVPYRFPNHLDIRIVFGFPAQRASKVERIHISWRHRVVINHYGVYITGIKYAV